MPPIYTRARRSPGVAALSRRSFLLAATTGIAATAGALIVKTGPQPSHRNNLRADSKRGYEVTEHIRNYYRTARI
jgi:hypothetical protein